MAKETVLLYNLDNEKGKKIKSLLVMSGVRTKVILPDMYDKKIGVLAGIVKEEDITEDEKCLNNDLKGGLELNAVKPITEEMLVISGFSDAKLNEFLYAMRKKGIERVDLKAVITPSNYLWNSYELYSEILNEHELMKQNRQK